MQERSDEQRCPVCGEGVFTDVAYEDPGPGGPQPRLAGDSYEVLLFSCGHEVKGTPLELAEPDRMTVERRESQETAGPVHVEPEPRGIERRGGAMIRLETPDPEPSPSPGPIPTPQPEPGPVPQPEPPTPEPSPRPEPPPDSEPPIRA